MRRLSVALLLVAALLAAACGSGAVAGPEGLTRVAGDPGPTATRGPADGADAGARGGPGGGDSLAGLAGAGGVGSGDGTGPEGTDSGAGGAAASVSPPGGSGSANSGTGGTEPGGSAASGPGTDGPGGSTAPAPAPPPSQPAPAPAPTPGGPAGAQRAGLIAYTGLGAWVDVFDWTEQWTGGRPRVGVAEVDHMAAEGVQTLYIQAARYDWAGPGDVVEPERLLPMIRRAKQRGLRVVTWYLPTFTDPGADLRRLLAVAGLEGVDSVAVDIESRHVADVDERNRRLIWLSAELRAALPTTALGSITLAPVHIEVINPAYWPRFPWREIHPYYDVWLPMSYQTDRRADSGWRDAYRYGTENIDRLRANLGDPEARVHLIGGIADRMPPDEAHNLLRAAVDRRAVGGSVYDYDTTPPELWPPLRGFRSS